LSKRLSRGGTRGAKRGRKAEREWNRPHGVPKTEPPVETAANVARRPPQGVRRNGPSDDPARGARDGQVERPPGIRGADLRPMPDARSPLKEQAHEERIGQRMTQTRRERCSDGQATATQEREGSRQA